MTKWKSTLEEIGQACVDWAIDTGECHLCETSVRGAHAEAHADGCPVGAYLASTNAVAPRDAVTRPDLPIVPERPSGVVPSGPASSPTRLVPSVNYSAMTKDELRAEWPKAIERHDGDACQAIIAAFEAIGPDLTKLDSLGFCARCEQAAPLSLWAAPAHGGNCPVCGATSAERSEAKRLKAGES